MDTCPQSGTPLKLIPAGTSKTTGKAYDSFYACSTKGCRGPHIPGATFAKPKAEKSDEEFWEKKAYKQCLWNYWLHHSSPALKPDEIWRVFKSIETDADKRFLNEELPTIQQDSEESVSDIPF